VTTKNVISSVEESIYPCEEEITHDTARRLRKLVKMFKSGVTIKQSDMTGLPLPKIGSGGQASIKLVRISRDESYVIKTYLHVEKDNKKYDETIIVDETNDKTESYV
jgi:hypothetical protein